MDVLASYNFLYIEDVKRLRNCKIFYISADGRPPESRSITKIFKDLCKSGELDSITQALQVENCCQLSGSWESMQQQYVCISEFQAGVLIFIMSALPIDCGLKSGRSISLRSLKIIFNQAIVYFFLWNQRHASMNFILVKKNTIQWADYFFYTILSWTTDKIRNAFSFLFYPEITIYLQFLLNFSSSAYFKFYSTFWLS